MNLVRQAFPLAFASWLVALTGCGGGGSAGPAPVDVAVPVLPRVNSGALAWAAPSATWPQGAAAVVATVTRSGSAEGSVTVSYMTQDGTALAGRDYLPAAGTLSWGDKDTSPRSVPVLLAPNAPSNSPLTFDLVLGAAGASPLAAQAEKTSITLAPTVRVPATLPQFDLSKWRLDLPVDANGGSGGVVGAEFAAAAIAPRELSSTYVGRHFYGDAEGRLVFTAPANGAATSPGSGSNHTRSELREIYTGPNAQPNNSWIGNGTLTAACRVHAVASASQVAVIGQLRGLNNNLALLLYRPAQRDVAIDVYAANVSGSAHTRTRVAANVNLGDLITYSLGYQNGVLTAVVNGAVQTIATGPSWQGVPLYFKLGAYHTAPNTGNAPNDLTMVTFDSFTVTH